MKSRFAILAMLVTGMLFSTAGAGLAPSRAIQDNASVSSTPTPVCTPTPHADRRRRTAAETRPAAPAAATCARRAASCPPRRPSPGRTAAAPPPTRDRDGGVLPAEEAARRTEESDTQPERQAAAAAETSQLPFTGFAAIPVLLGGLALLTGGLILRRRTRELVSPYGGICARPRTSRRRAVRLLRPADREQRCGANGSSGLSRSAASARTGAGPAPDTP